MLKFRHYSHIQLTQFGNYKKPFLFHAAFVLKSLRYYIVSTKSNVMKKGKEKSTKEKDAWYLVTSEGKTVAMVRGKESAKAVYSGGDSPLDKFETFEEAYREFKKRWKGVPKGNRGRRNISLEETWYFLLTKDELVAVVIGFLECEKILMHYIYMTGGGLRKVSASTYTAYTGN